MKLSFVILILISLSGCMSLTVSNSLLIGSGVTQEKPIEAGISTTGKDIGDAVRAAGWGGPNIGEFKGIVEEFLKERKNRP